MHLFSTNIDLEEKHVRNLDMAMASRFASSTLISFPSGLYLICPVGQKCTCLSMIKAYKELSGTGAPLRIILFTKNPTQTLENISISCMNKHFKH